jgi:hypothetical protein
MVSEDDRKTFRYAQSPTKTCSGSSCSIFQDMMLILKAKILVPQEIKMIYGLVLKIKKGFIIDGL